ncbi:MAG: DUF6600 domain-containing protein, partial [Terracidiphilus sp.]
MYVGLLQARMNVEGGAVKGWGAMKDVEKNWFSPVLRVLGFGLAAVALASVPGLMAQQAGPAARAVRLSNVEGQVQLSQGNTVLAAQAVVNTPLFEGTQIKTSEDGRAEIQFEDGSIARVSPDSSLTLGELRQQGDSTDTLLVLDSGLGYFELQGDTASDHIRVQFDGNTVTTTGFSVLRINLDNPPGEVAIFSGNAHLEGGNTIALDLHGGESVKLNGVDPGNYALSEAIEPDSWDAWNSDRDQALTSQEADRTVATNSVPNSNNPAWSDLDANGNWYNVPGQGYVWSPYEAQNAGWDPYGCGSWVSTPAYGYGWASCEPWGFMPYNSGLWNYYDGFGWGWEPGFGGPWWGGGIWVSNIGNAPFHYHPPIRPRGGPVRPGGGNLPIRAGGRYEPNPVIAVNRMRYTAAGPPIRAKGSPVTVAGNTVQPLRPIASRPTYAGEFTGGTRPGTNPGTAGGVRYGYIQSPNAGIYSHPANGATAGGARYPAYYGGYYGRPSAPPSRGGSGGGASASRSS